jgi:hypothetical protein
MKASNDVIGSEAIKAAKPEERLATSDMTTITKAESDILTK